MLKRRAIYVGALSNRYGVRGEDDEGRYGTRLSRPWRALVQVAFQMGGGKRFDVWMDDVKLFECKK